MIITAGLHFAHGSSGVLGNIGGLSLFGIAGTSYLEKQSRPVQGTRSTSLLLMATAVTVGYFSGEKQAALTPIAAWIIGRAGGGGILRVRYLVAGLLLIAIVFATIQGGRDAEQAGNTVRNPVTAFRVGLTRYNLAVGDPQVSRGPSAILSNVANGVLYRLKGADYLIAIAAKAPAGVPYQNGASLWQPAMSVVHGAQSLVTLAPQYRQLSMGRYIDQTFVSDNPQGDTSSQSTTIPGDLYLNFGPIGIALGMLILGALYAAFDRRYSRRSPVGTAVFCFAGLSLISLDSNIDYILVTAGLRLFLALATVRVALSTAGLLRISQHPLPGNPLSPATSSRV